MNGFARTFWAVAADLCRAIAWLPVGLGESLMAWARYCEARSKPPSKPSGELAS